MALKLELLMLQVIAVQLPISAMAIPSSSFYLIAFQWRKDGKKSQSL